MHAREIADHLRDSRGVNDEDAALMLGRWIASRLDMDPIWEQVDQLADEAIGRIDGELLQLRPPEDGSPR